MSIAISPLAVSMIDDVIRLMNQGDPLSTARTASDYWAYATLFSSTCPVAHVNEQESQWRSAAGRLTGGPPAHLSLWPGSSPPLTALRSSRGTASGERPISRSARSRSSVG